MTDNKYYVNSNKLEKEIIANDNHLYIVIDNYLNTANTLLYKFIITIYYY